MLANRDRLQAKLPCLQPKMPPSNSCGRSAIASVIDAMYTDKRVMCMISGDQYKQSFFICITSHPPLIKICAPVLVLLGFLGSTR